MSNHLPSLQYGIDPLITIDKHSRVNMGNVLPKATYERNVTWYGPLSQSPLLSLRGTSNLSMSTHVARDQWDKEDPESVNTNLSDHKNKSSLGEQR